MGAIHLSAFAGIAPRIPKRSLPPNMAQIAQNYDLRNGTLTPLKSGLQTNTPTKTGTLQSIYLFANQYWFSWTTDVDVVRNPVAGDTTERTYFTGDGYPKATDNSIALTGGTDYPMAAYRLGLPAPSSSPTITLGTGGGCQTADQISATFYVTFVTGWGEEGPPSPASTVTDICPGQQVTISLPGAPPTGNYNVTSVNIYCAVAGYYQFVASELIATASHVISAFATTDLGTECPSETWIAPPDTMIGLISLPNGILAGFDGNEVLFTPPYIPHAWPTGYRYSVDYPIVAIGVAGSMLVVATTATPYLIEGVDPAAMNVVRLRSLPQACVSKRSMVSMGYSVVYASPDGLVSVDETGRGAVVTEKWMLKSDWQAFAPGSVYGEYWEGVYVGFYPGGSFIFDPANDGLKTTTITGTAGYNDLTNDIFYFLDGSNILKWNAGTALTGNWKSGVTRSNQPFSPAAVRVVADTYPATVTIYGDGQVYDTVTVDDDNGVPLVAGDLINEIEITIQGIDVTDVYVASSMMALVV